jgi:hypothetical protein
MYSISDELRQRFEQGERKTARVAIGNYAVDQTITEADIVSNGLSIDRYCVTGNKIEIGSAVAAELSLVLDNSSGKFDEIVFEGVQLFVEIGIAGDENSYIPCGKFTVDEPPRNNTRISLKALDYMMLFDNKADVSKLNFSNAEALVESVCSKCEVELSSNVDFTKFANTNIELSEPTTEVTYRQLLQWACEILGVCAYMDGVGELMLAWYSDDINATFDPSVRYSGTMHETDIEISGVTIKKGDSDITKGTVNDVVLIIENNQLIDGNLEKIKAIAEGVLAKTGGFTYRPFECSCLPMPYLYPLDKVAYTYKDKNGKDVSFYSVITNHTFGLNTTSSFAAKGETAQQKNYSKSKGVTKAEIDAAVAEAMKGVNLETDRFYVMYSAYPNGRLNGEENGGISWSDTAEADTQYLGTCVTSNKTQPDNPDEYSWVKIGGKDGAPATSYHMVVNTSVIKKDANGVLSPMSVTFSAISQTGLESPVSCKCCFKRYTTTAEDMSSWNLVSTVTNSTTSFLASNIGDDVKAIRCTMYLNNSSTTVLDEQVVPIIRDGGEDAYTVILSNENHTFPGSNGKADKSSIDCHIEVYKGSTRLKTQITKINDVNVSGNTEVTSISGFKFTPHNNSVASDNNYVTIEASPTSTNTLTNTNGTIMFTISADGQTFTKDFSYSVVFNGTDGAPSTIYSVLPSVNAIIKDKKNKYNPTKLTVSAKKQVGNGALSNYSGRFHIETTADMSEWDDTDGKGYESSTNQSSYEFALPDGIKAVRCSLHLADQAPTSTNLLDQQVIPIVADGTDGDGKDAYTVVLSNENHTFVGDDTKVLGTQTTTCDVIAYKGATQQKVTLGTAVLPTGAKGITVSPSNSGTISAMLTIRVDSTLSPLSGSVSIPVTLEGGEKFTKTFSYSVALKGDKGDPGKGISSITEHYFASDNSTTPPTSVQVAPFNYSMSVAEVSKKSSSIGCSLGGDGYYAVNMNSTNSAYILIKLTFTVTKATDIILKCINYAENNCDYMVVSKISTNQNDYKFGTGAVSTDDQRYAEKNFQSLHSADPVDIEYKNVSAGTHYVYIKVWKDTSITKDYETFKFKAVEKESWPTTIPSDYGTDKPYLWNYTKTIYTDGTFQESSPAVISCYGGQGEDGVGISSIEEYYLVTNSNVTPSISLFPTTPNGNNIPKPDATKQYLWNYEKIIYTKGDPAVTDVRLVCVFGKNGDNGRGVDSVKTQYYLSTSNSSQTGGSWQDTMPTWQADRYLWKMEVITYKNPAGTEYGTPILDTSWDKLGTIDSVVNAAEASLSETLLLGNGLKKTTLADGSIYYHTNSVLQNSVAGDIICVLNSNGFGVCKSGWNDGSLSFSYGSTFAGAALWDTVTARKISADMIEAGTIEALSTAKLHSSWNLENGKIVFLSEDERVVGSIHAELTRVVNDVDYPLAGVGLTIEDLDNDTITQIANGVIRLGDPNGILVPVMWLAEEKLKQFWDKTYVIDMTKAPNNHETIITKDEIQTKKIRCEDVELFLNSQKPNESTSLYGMFEKWVSMFGSYRLYPSSGEESRSNGVITLSDSVENYECIEIYFNDGSGHDLGSVKVYSPNEKSVVLSAIRSESDGMVAYTYSTLIEINGNTITPDTSCSTCFATSSTKNTFWPGNSIYITRVVGVGYIGT